MDGDVHTSQTCGVVAVRTSTASYEPLFRDLIYLHCGSPSHRLYWFELQLCVI